MLKKIVAIFFGILMTTQWCLAAPLDETVGGAAGSCQGLVVWPHEKSDLEPDPGITFGRLTNGFRYVLMENREPRNRVSVHLNVQAGSLHENENERGLAHFLEHMLFNGSTHFKPGELVEYFQRIGMQFGPDANAHTSFGETVYDILLPGGDEKDIAEALLVLRDYAEGALLLEDEIERERKVVLAEKRTRDSAAYRIFEETLKFELEGSRYPDRLPIGLDSVIEEAGRERFKRFYDTWYRPENLTIVMVGEFDTGLAKRLIEEKFVHLAAREPARGQPESGVVNHRMVKSFYHYEKEVGRTTVSVERVDTVLREPDSFDFQKRMLTKQIADRMIQNRIDRLISQSKAAFTSASIDSGIHLQEIFYREITAKCPPEKWDETLAQLEQILRQAMLFGFREAELSRVQKEFLAEMEKAVKGSATRTSQSLARKIIWHLNNDRVLQSPAQEMALFGPVIESITPEQAHQAFLDSWKGDDLLLTVTGDALIKTDPENTIRAVFEKSRKKTVGQPEAREAAVFPYLERPVQRGSITREQTIDDLKITTVDFANGVRLNLKPTDFKDNEVLFVLAFGRGRSSEPRARAGLGPLAEAVLNESGTGSLSKEDLAEALAGKNTTIQFSVEEDRFSFTGRSVTGELAVMFQLLQTYLLDPGYRPDAYGRVIEQFKQRYEALSQSVDGSMELSVRRFLAGGDSRFGLPPFAEFQKNTLDDVRRWIDEALSRREFELSVVGDFDAGTAIDLAAVYLGTLPEAQTKKETPAARQPVFPSGKSLSLQVHTQIPKGLVGVIYPTDDFWEIDKTRRMVILGEIVSDMMRVRIREKLGAAYSPYAANSPSRAYPGYGLFYSLVHVAPEEAEPVQSAIVSIASDLVADGPTEDQFKRALDPVLTGLKDLRRTNQYWLQSVLAGSKRHPQQIQWARTILDAYLSMRREQVHALAKEYLKNAAAARISVLPVEPK